MGNTKHIMPAGTYWVGDLSYTLGHERGNTWHEVCALMWAEGTEYERTGRYGKMKLADGREYCIFSTAFGDGSYRCRNLLAGTTASLGVDAGVIGCVKLEDIRDYDEAEALRLGLVHVFAEDFECWDDDGTLHFGELTVETRDETDSDEYEEGADLSDEEEEW